MVKLNLPISILKLFLGTAFEASADAIKLKLAISYLKMAKGSRIVMIQMAFIIFCLVLLAVGLVIIPVALCLFMPWSTNVKAIVAISFGVLYTIFPLIALMVAFSEKRWLRTLSVDRLLHGSK